MDMPLIDNTELEEAMCDSQLILGPAEDGGYWVIGGTNIPLSVLTIFLGPLVRFGKVQWTNVPSWTRI